MIKGKSRWGSRQNILKSANKNIQKRIREEERADLTSDFMKILTEMLEDGIIDTPADLLALVQTYQILCELKS
jgi:hypothetical protein